MATPARRITTSILRVPALSLSRAALKKDELVYVLVADKKLRYPSGRSRIAYIGMTESGVHRITKSAADRAEKILSQPGVEEFMARVVHFPLIDKRSARHWKKRPSLLLERALLISFREKYGDIPLCNSTGSKMKATNGEFQCFGQHRIGVVLEDLA